MNRVTNILFCGTGGQGVLTAAEVCGWAALDAGYHVKKSEVHGMAQRGGSVESHLRFGRIVYSPLIAQGEADFLVPFHADEEARLRPFLSAGGVNLSDRLQEAQALEDKRFMNTFLLGVLAGRLGIALEHWRRAMRTVYRGRRLDENVLYFERGRSRS